MSFHFFTLMIWETGKDVKTPKYPKTKRKTVLQMIRNKKMAGNTRSRGSAATPPRRVGQPGEGDCVVAVVNYSRRQAVLSKYRDELRKTPTKGELILGNLLEQHNIRFIFQKGWMAGHKTFVISDFYLPEIKTVVEVDGSCHELPEQKLKDREKDKYYKQRRFSVVRVRL